MHVTTSTIYYTCNNMYFKRAIFILFFLVRKQIKYNNYLVVEAILKLYNISKKQIKRKRL